LVEPVDADELVTRTLAPHDRHLRRGDAHSTSDQVAQRAIRASADRRCAYACEQYPVADADELVAVRSSLEPDQNPRVCHGLE
jgi:hypothetical protein